MKPAEQNFWQIDPFEEFLTVSAPPCLDGTETTQSTRFELSRCLGNKSGLLRLVRAPNRRFAFVFESPRPNMRVALVRFPPAPTRPSRELQSKQKGTCGRIPSLGPAGPTAPVIVSARDQKAALSLETS